MEAQPTTPEPTPDPQPTPTPAAPPVAAIPPETAESKKARMTQRKTKVIALPDGTEVTIGKIKSGDWDEMLDAAGNREMTTAGVEAFMSTQAVLHGLLDPSFSEDEIAAIDITDLQVIADAVLVFSGLMAEKGEASTDADKSASEVDPDGGE